MLPKIALAVLVAILLTPAYIIAFENKRTDRAEKAGFEEASRTWQPDSWWSGLQRGKLYCFVHPAPTSELIREPIARGLSVTAQRRDYFCPFGTIVVLENGSQYPLSPPIYLNGSLEMYQQGDFDRSIEISKAALALKPDYAAAYNNICAARNMQQQWSKAIAACSKAISLKPDFQLAKNNLALARKMSMSTKTVGP